jgi:hypothetical protein
LPADENLFVKELHSHERDANEELALVDATRDRGPDHRAADAGAVGPHRRAQHQGAGDAGVGPPGAINHANGHRPFIEAKQAALGM